MPPQGDGEGVIVEPQASVSLEGIPEDVEAQSALKDTPTQAVPEVVSSARELSPLLTLLLSLENGWGIAQEQALALASTLHASGRYDVRLCCPPDSALAQRARQQEASLPLVPVSSPRHLPTLFRLWRCQQRKQPLLAHSFDPDALQLAERLTRVRRVGSTVLLHSCLASPVAGENVPFPGESREAHTSHEVTPISADQRRPDQQGKGGSTLPLFAHKSWQRADRILCASEAVRSPLAGGGLDVARLCVVHPGLDAAALPLRRERADGRFVFVAVESLQQGAGLFVLLRAMTALWQRTDLPPWEVRVVGAGEALMPILNEARSLGVEARLALLSQQDLGEVLPRCDALLVPNRQPCGNIRALMAAWCCALPLICTDMTPHGEVLRAASAVPGSASASVPRSAQSAALSVPPGDAQALAAAMIRLLTEPALCARLAVQGAGMRGYADYARMVAQTVRQYEDCLNRQGWVLPPMQVSAPVVSCISSTSPIPSSSPLC